MQIMSNSNTIDLHKDAFLQISKQKEDKEAALKDKYKGTLLDFPEMWGRKDEVQQFILENILPAGNLALFAGEEGVGKTQFVLQLCLFLALKEETFCGQKIDLPDAKCLYVSTEDSWKKAIQSWKVQSDALGPHHHKNFTDGKTPPIKFLEGTNCENYAELIEIVTYTITKTGVNFIIIDTLSDAISTLIDGNENNAKDVNAIFQPLQKLCNKYGVTIIVLHHVSKEVLKRINLKQITERLLAPEEQTPEFINKEDIRGSGRIAGKPRTVWGFSHHRATATGTEHVNYWHILKNNLMTDEFKQNSLKLKFDSATLSHTFQGLVNIKEMETGEKNEALGGYNPKEKEIRHPKTIPFKEHCEKLDTIFDKGHLSIIDFKRELKNVYNLKSDKVNCKAEDGGFISYLKQENLIKLDTNTYCLGVEHIEQDRETPF